MILFIRESWIIQAYEIYNNLPTKISVFKTKFCKYSFKIFKTKSKIMKITRIFNFEINFFQSFNILI